MQKVMVRKQKDFLADYMKEESRPNTGFTETKVPIKRPHRQLSRDSRPSFNEYRRSSAIRKKRELKVKDKENE